MNCPRCGKHLPNQHDMTGYGHRCETKQGSKAKHEEAATGSKQRDYYEGITDIAESADIWSGNLKIVIAALESSTQAQEGGLTKEFWKSEAIRLNKTQEGVRREVEERIANRTNDDNMPAVTDLLDQEDRWFLALLDKKATERAEK